MFLDHVVERQLYKILSVKDGKDIKLKLTSMGIYPGVNFKVIKNDNYGPIILALNLERISIGRGLAEKIEVEKE